MYIKQPTKRLIVRQIDQSREANMLKQKKMLIAQFILSLSAMFFYIPMSHAIGGPNGYGPQVDAACSNANGTTPFSAKGCSLCHNTADFNQSVEPEWTAYHSIGPLAFCYRAPDSVINSPSGNVTINKGESVNFSGAVTGTAPDPVADPEPFSYSWDFGDATSGSMDQNPAHVFDKAGTFNVTLIASDGIKRSDSTPAKITVTVVDSRANQAPNGTIVSPATDVTIKAGESVSFSGSATDPENNTPFSYQWNFGDGTVKSLLTDPNISHTYSSAGIYTAMFTVTDSEGLSDPSPATRTITVNRSSAACTDNDKDMFSPEGGVCGPIDCDDYNAAVNPGAIEACGDQIDNDCNGDTDRKDAHCSGPNCIGDLLKQVEILKAAWDGDDGELKVKGTWGTEGAIVNLSDARTGEPLGSTKVRASKGSDNHEDRRDHDNRDYNYRGKTYFWEFELEHLAVVPCRVRAEIEGRIGERDVAYAPVNCSGKPPVTNNSPVAKDDKASTTQKVAVTIPVLANDSDEDKDALTIVMFSQPKHGVVTRNGETLTYTPKGRFTDEDSFTYTISDHHGGTDEADVHVDVSKAKVGKGRSGHGKDDD